MEPILRAKDMVDSNVEHLGVMAYAAHFQWIPPRTAPSLTVAAGCDSYTTRIHTPVRIPATNYQGYPESNLRLLTELVVEGIERPCMRQRIATIPNSVQL